MPAVYITLQQKEMMTLIIFSEMPTFAVVLILKHLSRHAAVKPVLAM
jgi:hypothetical protein